MKSNSINNTKSKTIVKRILIPMLALIIIEIILLTGSIFGKGVIEKLIQNEKDILKEKVINRKNYLENEMLINWSNVDLAVETVNQKVEKLIAEGAVGIDTISNSSEQSIPLLELITEDVITMLRNNNVTGAFVVFNNSNLEGDMRNKTYYDKTGIYLRDSDPTSGASVENSDLLIEIAPAAIVKSLDIATDEIWQPMFCFGKNNHEYFPFLYEPFQQAYKGTIEGTYKDYGYWSEPYALHGDNTQAISYSVPLILDDGTVYGVLGVEITLDYLKKLLPYQEIMELDKGSYLLGVNKTENQLFDHVLISGPVFKEIVGNDDATEFDNKKEELYTETQTLDLYNSNTPFSYQKWALLGIVPLDDLTAFSYEVTSIVAVAIFITLFIGILGSLLVCALVANPIRKLAGEMRHTEVAGGVSLTRTHIEEIDQLAEAIENLSRDVIDSAAKFAEILKMASVQIAVFEIDFEKDSIFITDQFFRILGQSGISESEVTIDQFKEILQELKQSVLYEAADDENYILRIKAEGAWKYVRVSSTSMARHCIGLAEDITKTILEKKTLEYERDYDLLTGLINRRAFQREVKVLFGTRHLTLKIAALVMLDLDNLKYINDNYGHDYGDLYIQRAAEIFKNYVPEGTIVARMAGDEFYMFFYGYNTQDEIRSILSVLKKGINEQIFTLPTMENRKIEVSGGVAWYPKDSNSYEELFRYSDFAMYQVKQSIKGEMKDFDIGIYNKEMYQQQNKAELKRLISEKLVTYHLQPIIDAETGLIFAYEALLRTNMATLRSPLEVLELAKKEKCLQQIENLTWEKAMERYVYCVENGKINTDCKIFINSLADYSMNEKEVKKIESLYRPYLSSVVLEVTEAGKIDDEAMAYKRRILASWDAEIALDDYGSGYNGDQTLLSLEPVYIKVDMSIIRNIHCDVNKQVIVEHIIAYAHGRNIKVVAEGIECRDEMDRVIELGADYLQGYYLGKPLYEPVRFCNIKL